MPARPDIPTSVLNRAYARAVALTIALGLNVAAAPAFNRDIRPILADNCLACHGPDPGTRKAGLRLDTREGLFSESKKEGPVVVPGQPEDSALWKRIVTGDPDDLMPPPESHKELTADQRDRLREWILAGAPWQPHWAFIAPERPPVPATNRPEWVRNPLDAFILARLEAAGLDPAPEADRRTLARRVALDLTGLPPSPAEVEAFVADPGPRAYERYVDRLLDSPAWGEHRARYWLDAARYADTHGYHFDNYREMWPYRDWVIRAFNANMPFDRFTLEQLAGDLLPEPTLDQLVATGFQRCNMTTNEGGTIEEENLALYANDRVTTTGWVWLGLTANCAACHDHKFDPVTMRDFYSLATYFRNTAQPGYDGNVRDSSPSVTVPQTEGDLHRWTALPGEIADAEARRDARRDAARPGFETWLSGASASEYAARVDLPGLQARLPLTEGSGNEVDGQAGDRTRFTTAADVRWESDGPLGPAPVLTPSTTFDLGNVGDFERDQPFSYGAWVRVPSGGRYETVLARMDQEQDFRGWDLFTHDRNYAVHIIHKWPEDALKVVTTDNALKPGQWQHVFVTYDGSGKASGIRILIDGKPAPVRTEADGLTDTIRTATTLRVGQRSRDQVLNDGRVQDVRVYGRRLGDDEVRRLALDGPVAALLGRPTEARTAAQQETLFRRYLQTSDPDHAAAERALADLKAEREAIRARSPVTHIQRERADREPVAHVLFRGQYDQKREEVRPAVIAALNSLPVDAPANRLGLARWLLAPDHPLTARVTVNRFWQEIFGTGLVRTTEDFGVMGEAPSHPELLDWLAVEFRESGWDVKAFHRLLVTSATYRQSAATTPWKLDRDPANRLLSRGPRFRMDAEMIRDYALAAAGLLDQRVGGPSVRPYQPPGVWEAVAMPESNTKRYVPDSGSALYRRSVYTFWKRAAPPASMEVFNAPSRETCTVRRERTNTPLQALATLNDPQLLEAARILAEAALRDAGSPEAAIHHIAIRVLLRPLRSAERPPITSTLNAALKGFGDDPEGARRFLQVGESPVPPDADPVHLAALTLVANQLLNLDEVLNK